MLINIIAFLRKGINRHINNNYYLIIHGSTVCIYRSIKYYNNGQQEINEFGGSWMYLSELPYPGYDYYDYNYYAKSEIVQKYISLL